MKDKLIGLLMGCGVVLANDVPDNQVIDQIMQLVTKNKNEAATLSNEKTTASARVSTLENEAVSLNAKLTAAQTALSNEQGRFSVERTGRASALVDLAITQGRLAPSDREARITALSNSAQFDADAAALASQAVTHKTEAGLVESSRKTLANGGDPVTAFKAAVADRVTKGDTKPKAIAFVIANNRDLHHAYIKAGGSSSI